jgi:hypothetical protein
MHYQHPDGSLIKAGIHLTTALQLFEQTEPALCSGRLSLLSPIQAGDSTKERRHSEPDRFG